MFRNMATIILEDYARYYSEVDKDALAKYLEETFNNYVGQIKWERNVAMEQLEIHGIPFCGKVDMQAVRHGHWIDIGNNGTFRCSVCEKNASKMKYCGNCGAKMDRGVSEDADQ